MKRLSILFALVGVVTAARVFAQDPAVDRLKTYRFGDDQAITLAVSKRVDEVRAVPASRANVARALASVLQSDASFDAKQHACRMLVSIGSEAEAAALAALLTDEPLGHYAVLALARIPGAASTTALRNALPSAPSRVKMDIAIAIAARRDTAAVPALKEMLSGTDDQEADAAASALARILYGGAAEALTEAYKGSVGARRAFLADGLLLCARNWDAEGNTRMAGEAYALLEQSDQPALRAAALRGLASLRGASGMSAVLKALRDDDVRLQAAGADIARTVPGADAVRKLGEALPTLSPRAKLLLVTSLADRGDRAAAPAVTSLTKDPDPDARLAAIRALGTLGTAASVPSLLQAAATGKTADKEAARSSLARLTDRAADAALAASAASGSSETRAEAIIAIGGRSSVAAVPKLIEAAKDRNAAVSSAAARVLRDIAGPEHLPSLLSLFLSAPSERRADLAEAVAETARRGSTEAQRTGPILKRLATSKPADRAYLYLALRQIGGEPALAALRKGLSDPSPDARIAAVRQLAEWPTDAPMADLLTALNSAGDRRARTLALRGYIRMIGLNEARTPAQMLGLYRSAASLATGADEKRLILGGLGKVGSLESLDLAETLGKDPTARGEADLAITEIARFTAGAASPMTQTILGRIVRDSSSEEAKNRARAILGIISKFGDFVTGWEVSPAYQRAGLGHTQLFDTAFPPEVPAQQSAVPWRLMPIGTMEQPWLLDLLALYGGEQKVAYLRTIIWASQTREAVLELGSDDGLKVWMNGRVVLSNNTARAVAPGQERVKVALTEGRNELMLKITQNVMGWGACARFTNPDGSPATGLRVVPGLQGHLP